ncbi:hypothetical protein BKA66DRAFT_515502 [Pyrenochaeta sp. MPI-SDFR-AT-0127]|nr:hypothetical protein BKA66DRAFT_515502 [Pyrenochaeta sp. MPI-SDFR-AT-0127]
MANTKEDDWEYEYDENETEDFYIPLDLSNVPGAQVPMVSQGRPGHPTLLKSRLRALNAARGQPVEIDINSSDGQDTTTMGDVQIIGLHTQNPLIMYNDQLLKCQWMATIGTDMFFVKPTLNASAFPSPLLSLPAVDLLSLGSTKLVAKVGRLRPCEILADDTSDAQPTNVSTNILATSTVSPQATSKETSPTTRQVNVTPTSFLARLNQAKTKRGETSRLAISETSDGFRLVFEEMGQDLGPTDVATLQNTS